MLIGLVNVNSDAIPARSDVIRIGDVAHISAVGDEGAHGVGEGRGHGVGAVDDVDRGEVQVVQTAHRRQPALTCTDHES
jgi:hypothetical protein